MLEGRFLCVGIITGPMDALRRPFEGGFCGGTGEPMEARRPEIFVLGDRDVTGDAALLRAKIGGGLLPLRHSSPWWLNCKELRS